MAEQVRVAKGGSLHSQPTFRVTDIKAGSRSTKSGQGNQANAKVLASDHAHESIEWPVFNDESEEPQILDLPKHKRLEQAKTIMERNEATEVNIGVGEFAHLTEDTIVKRTQDGFVLYHVQQSG